MIAFFARLFGYVRVTDHASYGHFWPPRSRWVRARDVPPWGLAHYGRPDQCQVRMRAPGGISMWNCCDLDADHKGVHRWTSDVKPSNVYPEGEHYEGSFTTEAAVASWGRRASLDEMLAYERGELEGARVWKR